jgi:hypothetical protein
VRRTTTGLVLSDRANAAEVSGRGLAATCNSTCSTDDKRLSIFTKQMMLHDWLACQIANRGMMCR